MVNPNLCQNPDYICEFQTNLYFIIHTKANPARGTVWLFDKTANVLSKTILKDVLVLRPHSYKTRHLSLSGNL